MITSGSLSVEVTLATSTKPRPPTHLDVPGSKEELSVHPATPPTHLDVPGSEEELSVEVAFLNDVHVRHVDHTLWTRPNAHHGQVLQDLTPDCTCTDLHTHTHTQTHKHQHSICMHFLKK